ALSYLAYEDTECDLNLDNPIDGRALGLLYPFDGCMDESACNYNSNYLESDPSACCFGTCGCSLEEASNYDPEASCGITENCVYGIEGRIYHDVNLNSTRDDGEDFLEGITVEILQTGETVDTDVDGFFSFPTNNPGYYHIIVHTTEELSFRAQTSPYPVNSITTFEYELGLTSEPSPCCFTWPAGIVFNDLNQNGVHDDGEEGVPNIEVTLMPENIVLTTNEFGEFEFDPVPNSWHNLYAQASDELPYVTTGYPQYVGFLNSGDVAIGLSDGLPNIDFNVNYYYDQILLCNSESSNQLTIFNSSNVPISGVIDVQLSDIYTEMSHPLGFDSIIDGHYYMSFTDIQPGSSGGIDGGNYSFITPLPDFLGESVFFTTHVTAYYNDQPIGSGDHHYTSIVTCAYDPNDIAVTPRGYSDEHYLLPSTDLEYKVRFQNAGNAPAQNVLVQDTIPEQLNLNTLELLSNS
ncbi:MAG: SdrD B-like domain-containing protein, partial [Flavobacteriales bacterium]